MHLILNEILFTFYQTDFHKKKKRKKKTEWPKEIMNAKWKNGEPWSIEYHVNGRQSKSTQLYPFHLSTFLIFSIRLYIYYLCWFNIFIFDLIYAYNIESQHLIANIPIKYLYSLHDWTLLILPFSSFLFEIFFRGWPL